MSVQKQFPWNREWSDVSFVPTPLDYTFYSTLYSFAHLSLLKKGLHLNYTVWECLSSTCYVLWALEDVELHEAHQLSALMELTFQQWEGMVGAARREKGTSRMLALVLSHV